MRIDETGFRKGNTAEQGIKRRHFHFNAFRSHKRGIGVAHFADSDIAERSTKDRKETHARRLADFDAVARPCADILSQMQPDGIG